MILLLACSVPLTVEKGDSTTLVRDSTSTVTTDDSVETIPGESHADSHLDSSDSASPPPPAADVLVDCNGAGDFTTIQAAIAATPSGKSIGLAPCTYTENIDFLGKSLLIFGIDGPATTILKSAGSGTVVSATRGESLGTELSRVTISGGRRNGDYGSALRVEQSVFRLSHAEITGTTGGYSVIYGYGANLELVDVSLHDNRVDRGGGIIILDNGSMVGQALQISCSGVDYGVYTHNSTLLLDSDIRCGDTYAVDVEGGELHVRRSRIESGGTAVFGEDNADTRNERLWMFHSALVGGNTAVSSSYMHVKAENDVFWGGQNGMVLQSAHIESYVHNSVLTGSSCGIRGDGYDYDFSWNAQSNTSAACKAESVGSLVGDPQFVNAPTNFHLAKGSPLIDAGSPDPADRDEDGSRNDIGMYGGTDP